MAVTRILHVTTHDEECGIAKYQAQFLEPMKVFKDVQNVVFEFSPNRTKIMTPEEFKPVLEKFSKQLEDFDIVHIQHEFSFYSHTELAEYVSEAKRQNKKVMITVHTALHAGIPTIGLKEIVSTHPRHVVGKKKLRDHQIRVHVQPMQQADLILVHNSVTANSLVSFGVKRERILQITMPVPELDFSLKTTEIQKNLNRSPGDIIFCTVGFLSENKGMKDALQALQELPENYKLAMIGGAHPSGANDGFVQEVKNMVKDLGLQERVYISGYIKEDEMLNALIRECDICVYPFHAPYYDGVTSASLNNAIANFKAVITYPTKPILEMNAKMPAVVTCSHFDPHELAEKTQNLDIEREAAVSKKYAEAFSYSKEARKLADLYIEQTDK